MNHRRGTLPIACCAAAVAGMRTTRFWRDYDRDYRSATLRAFVMRARSWQASSDMSVYMMFAGKVVLVALALARLG